MTCLNDNIPIQKFSDYSNNSHRFFIRSIEDIRKKAKQNLSIPRKLEFYKIVYVTGGYGSHKVDLDNVQLRPETLLLIS